MSQGSGKRKREATSFAVIPKSLLSYLMGALRTSFAHLKEVLIEKHELEFRPQLTQTSDFWDQLLEEMFRYLFLLAVNFDGNVPGVSPSGIVDKALHCLILDPVTYYEVCDEILTMHGVDSETYNCRVLPHNSLGGKDAEARRNRFAMTTLKYSHTFKQTPPAALWNDYQQPSTVATAPLVSSASLTKITRDNQVDITIHYGTVFTYKFPCKIKRNTPMGSVLISCVQVPGVSVPKFLYKLNKKNKGILTMKVTDTPNSLGLQNGGKIFLESVPGSIFVRCRDLNTKQLTLYQIEVGSSLSALFKEFAKRKDVDIRSLRFMLDNSRLESTDTPTKLDIQNGDEIEVITVQLGC